MTNLIAYTIATPESGITNTFVTSVAAEDLPEGAKVVDLDEAQALLLPFKINPRESADMLAEARKQFEAR